MNLFAGSRLLKLAHQMKASQFEEVPVRPGGVVFLGDSLTEGGLWHEWFPEIAVRNRGIDGDTTGDVLRRLDSATSGAPDLILLLIGTNDIARRSGALEIAGRTSRILEGLRDRVPGARLVLQSVLPRQASARDRVQEINTLNRAAALGCGATFLDLWPALATVKGELRAEFTLDGIHLTGLGYRAWVDVLRPVVKS